MGTLLETVVISWLYQVPYTLWLHPGQHVWSSRREFTFSTAFLFYLSFSTPALQWMGGTCWTVTHRGTHLPSQITPTCSLLLTKDEVSKYERLRFRNIYMGSMEKWQKSKLLITKDNKLSLQYCEPKWNGISQWLLWYLAFRNALSQTFHKQLDNLLLSVM